MDTMKVLVIDDDPVVFEVIRATGQTHGFDIHGAGTGEGGIESALSWKPDVIVLDLNLPDMMGFDVCRRLRDMNDTRNIPILMLTSETGQERVLEGFESGVDDYVRKPFDPPELFARLRVILMRLRGQSHGAGLLEDFLERALELQEQGNLEEAEHFYRKAIERDPDNLTAYNNLAVLCESQGRIDDAMILFRDAIARCTDGEGFRETLERNLNRAKRKKGRKK